MQKRASSATVFVAKVDEKDVPPGTVLRDLEQVYGSLESAFPR